MPALSFYLPLLNMASASMRGLLSLFFLIKSTQAVHLYCGYPHKDFRNESCLTPGGIDDFYSANLRCLNMGGFLPSIRDEDENRMVQAMAGQRLTGPGTWIGLDQRDHWADATEIDYTNYKEGLTVTNDNRTCTYLSSANGTWDQQPCTNRLGFVCQIDADVENNYCDPTAVGDTDCAYFTERENKICHPGSYCSKHWQIVTIMMTNNSSSYGHIISTLDSKSSKCGAKDMSYYMSPYKFLNPPTSFGLDPFTSGYYNKQYQLYPVDNTLNDFEAGYIISDMLEQTVSFFEDQPPMDGMGGMVHIFFDVDCANLCNSFFMANQTKFITDMISKGYYVNIWPVGGPNVSACANSAFPQCLKYSTTYCEIQTVDTYDTKLLPFCVPYKFPTGAIIGICGGIVAIIVLVAAFLYLRYQFKRHGKFSRFWKAMAGVGLSDLYGVEVDEWEIQKDDLEIFVDNELGSGAFAVVYEGKLHGRRPVDEIVPTAQLVADRKEIVAVKRVPPHADKVAKQEFISEVNFMKKLGYHSHILGMIGCIVAADLPLMVLEYCENGDLLGYVRKHKAGFNLEGTGTIRPKDLLSIAWQISDGLSYLKSLDLIHRDLAARNILLTKDLTAKISDFGLCRQPEMSDSSTIYVSRGGRLPVKWMAPESLREFHFSLKTDVWSYGIILWEMYTFGDIPFAATNPTSMLETLEDGERPSQRDIPDIIYQVMMDCWALDPAERKNIEDLKDHLNEILSSNSQYYGYVAVSNTSVIGIEEGIDFETEQTSVITEKI